MPYTFDGLLRKHGLSGVDLVSMDCEGCEYAVLSSIGSLRALRVTAWVIEGRGEAARRVRRLMKRHGYFVATEIGADTTYLRDTLRKDLPAHNRSGSRTGWWPSSYVK